MSDPSATLYFEGRATPEAADAGPILKPHETAVRGWASWLAIWVAALLLIQAVTGLWIYLAPFSIGSQLQVLVHVAAGIASVLPYLWYQLRHWLAWRGQKLTAEMVLGYLLMVMVLTCMASGLWLAWQAALGPRISRLWDLVHLVSGLGALALVVVHLLSAFLRRRPQMRQWPELRRSIRRFGVGVAGLGLATAAGLIVAANAWPVKPRQFPTPPGYSLASYVQNSEEYRGSPFAPSNARTEGGMLIDSELLSNSQSCGSAGCHEQILAEWEPSAHRFSAMNPSFQSVQKLFAADREPAETRYCAGCHDPISLFAGAKDIHNLSLSAPGMQEGCSCVVCHTIDKVDQRGNADYVLVPPQRYLGETAAAGWKKAVSDFLIRAYPYQHLADYDRAVMHAPEFCGVCHKQYVPEELNRFGVTDAQNQLDEWKNSHWNSDDPDQRLTCTDCHMRLVHDSTDPGQGEAGAIRRTADDRAHRHHGTIATNFFMPQVLKLPHWEKQVELTEEWIRGETVIPEIAHLWPSGPVASLHITAPPQAQPGEEINVRAVVTNRKAGHNLITGPLDFMRCWIHLRVLDAHGTVLAEWGGIDPATREIADAPGKVHVVGNSRKEGTLVLEGMPLDRSGEIIRKHQLWDKAGGKGKRVIFPNYTDSQVYVFQVPADAAGPLTVKADLNFRRYRQEFLDLMLPTLEAETGECQPLVPQATMEAKIALSTTPAAARSAQTASASVEKSSEP